MNAWKLHQMSFTTPTIYFSREYRLSASKEIKHQYDVSRKIFFTLYIMPIFNQKHRRILNGHEGIFVGFYPEENISSIYRSYKVIPKTISRMFQIIAFIIFLLLFSVRIDDAPLTSNDTPLTSDPPP